MQLRQLPAGTQPPFILTYNASTVPVLQLALAGQKLSEQQLFDIGVNFLRTQLAGVQGAQIPYPYGGKQPHIQVDLDPDARPRRLAHRRRQRDQRADPDSAAGTQKIGLTEYDVDMNSMPATVEELNDLPIRTSSAATSTSTTSRTFATATRRRPTSSGSTARARPGDDSEGR